MTPRMPVCDVSICLHREILLCSWDQTTGGLLGTTPTPTHGQPTVILSVRSTKEGEGLHAGARHLLVREVGGQVAFRGVSCTIVR